MYVDETQIAEIAEITHRIEKQICRAALDRHPSLRCRSSRALRSCDVEEPVKPVALESMAVIFVHPACEPGVLGGFKLVEHLVAFRLRDVVVLCLQMELQRVDPGGREIEATQDIDSAHRCDEGATKMGVDEAGGGKRPTTVRFKHGRTPDTVWKRNKLRICVPNQYVFECRVQPPYVHSPLVIRERSVWLYSCYMIYMGHIDIQMHA